MGIQKAEAREMKTQEMWIPGAEAGKTTVQEEKNQGTIIRKEKLHIR